MAVNKKAQWGGIWKTIKKSLDRENNGFLTYDELEEVFKEWFPLELEGKSLKRYFSKHMSVQNKQLINYKEIKKTINELIMQADKAEHQRRMDQRGGNPEIYSHLGLGFTHNKNSAAVGLLSGQRYANATPEPRSLQKDLDEDRD